MSKKSYISPSMQILCFENLSLLQSSRRKMKTSDILINEIHAASTETLKTEKC